MKNNGFKNRHVVLDEDGELILASLLTLNEAEETASEYVGDTVGYLECRATICEVKPIKKYENKGITITKLK